VNRKEHQNAQKPSEKRVSKSRQIMFKTKEKPRSKLPLLKKMRIKSSNYWLLLNLLSTARKIQKEKHPILI